MKLFPGGDRVFEVLSRYDDLLTLTERPDYEPGDTVALILQPDYGQCDGWYSPEHANTMSYFLYPWHNGRGNFLYADGHIRTLSEVPPREHWVCPVHNYEP